VRGGASRRGPGLPSKPPVHSHPPRHLSRTSFTSLCPQIPAPEASVTGALVQLAGVLALSTHHFLLKGALTLSALGGPESPYLPAATC
jgi:hypothetical protein